MNAVKFTESFDACVGHESADEARQKIADLTVRIHALELHDYHKAQPVVKQYEAEIKRLKKFIK